MYGICHLSIIPLRKDSTSKSELVSQLIYGELFKVLESAFTSYTEQDQVLFPPAQAQPGTNF